MAMARMGIIGSAGRMGKALTNAILAGGHSHAGGVDRADDVNSIAAISDCLIDFSAPNALEANLDAAVMHNCPIVIGTTGLDERHHMLIDLAASRIAVLQTGNTSLGITLLGILFGII